MFQALKSTFYFPIAFYFRFFARVKLTRWKPRVVVVTGSNGKTTTMAFIESQLGDEAYYSHHANSAYGIPFNILGLERKTLLPHEWIGLLLLAPFKAFSGAPEQKIYVVEADCDRPGEGTFLSTLLNPEITIWLSSSRTHSMNYDYLVVSGKFEKVEDAIAYEYGHFLERTGKLCIINSDSKLILGQIKRSKASTVNISRKILGKYTIDKDGSRFEVSGKKYSFNYLLPEVSFYSIQAAIKLLNYLGKKPNDFRTFKLPPGRSSIFKGINNTTIIDSCYNANLSSMTEIINMFNEINASTKWVVIGDMLEQGSEEKEEHEKLAKILLKNRYDRIILLGPRTLKYIQPILTDSVPGNKVIPYLLPKDVLKYITYNLDGGEMILFKGSRFMEGVIEHLLENKSDVLKLSRREKIWEIRRKSWGL